MINYVVFHLEICNAPLKHDITPYHECSPRLHMEDPDGDGRFLGIEKGRKDVQMKLRSRKFYPCTDLRATRDSLPRSVPRLAETSSASVIRYIQTSSLLPLSRASYSSRAPQTHHAGPESRFAVAAAVYVLQRISCARRGIADIPHSSRPAHQCLPIRSAGRSRHGSLQQRQHPEKVTTHRLLRMRYVLTVSID